MEEFADEELAMAADSLYEQFGNADEAEAYAYEEAAKAARTFQEARRLLTEVRGSRGYWPVVGIAVGPGSSSDRTPGQGRAAQKGHKGAGRARGRGSPKGRGKTSAKPAVRPPPSPLAQPAKRAKDAGKGARTGGRHHGPRTGPVCLICRQPGHIARDCPNRGAEGSDQARKRALGSYVGYLEAQGFAVSAADEEAEVLEFDVASLNSASTSPVGIWDCGATMSAGCALKLQPVFDAASASEHYERVDLEPAMVRFTFAGGEQACSETRLKVPLGILVGECLSIHSVPNSSTPILLGLDNLRHFQMVLDFEADTVYSKRLGRYLPTVRLPSGHLGLQLDGQDAMTPPPPAPVE